MKLSKIIGVLNSRRAYVLRLLEEAEPETGRWHRLNCEQRAIECALPILQTEAAHRQAQAMKEADRIAQ
jgi:hypothetical protein